MESAAAGLKYYTCCIYSVTAVDVVHIQHVT
jgi:hypothetical protein